MEVLCANDVIVVLSDEKGERIMQIPRLSGRRTLGEMKKKLKHSSTGVGVGLFLCSAFLWGAPEQATAAGCVDLGGNINAIGECEISTDVGTKSGVFTLNETLHVLSGGTISTSGADLNISTPLSIILDAGAVISVDNRGGCPKGNAGALVLEADSDHNLVGDVIALPGSQITANSSCSAGAILISGTTVNIGGEVKSVSGMSGTGRPGGGPITIGATCDLTVPGTVTSQGNDAGADRIHLEGGCNVTISGLVESTGNGHGPSTNPPNRCYDPNPPFPAPDPNDRRDKPANSAACVEVWAGNSLVINGEISADLRRSGLAGISWIDLFARGSIQITGGVDDKFAVHANGLVSSTDDGGLITVKSTEGSISASGSALQADATRPGGRGGVVTVEAAQIVTLTTARLLARGDFNPQGGLGSGGAIAVRAFNSSLNWQTGEGDVQPNNSGVITLTACAGITKTGTNFNGATPTENNLVCGGAPALPINPGDAVTYVILPDCLCIQPIAPCVCLEDQQRLGNSLTILGEGFLGDPNDPDDDTTLVGFSASCEPNPTCTATVKSGTRTNTSIEVTVPACAIPGNFIVVGIDGPFPNPTYRSFSCLKALLQPVAVLEPEPVAVVQAQAPLWIALSASRAAQGCSAVFIHFSSSL